MEQRKDKEKILSAGTLIFVACWAAYCASYLGRINYTAALTAIQNSTTLIADCLIPPRIRSFLPAP